MSDQSTYQKLEAHGREIDRLKSLQGGGSSGVTSVSGTAPVVSSGGATPAISLAVTPANPGGAVAIQASTPGSVQTGNIDVSGKIIANILDAPNFSIGGVTILATGTTFPGGGLVDGQRYRHETYKSWFTYDSGVGLWRQEASGIFGSSFPTVASGDNTVAPKIKAYRLDRNIEYYWDGTRWLSSIIYQLPFIARGSQPFAQGVVGFDTTIPNYAAGGGFYFTSFSIGMFPASVAQSTTNFYTVSAQYTDTSGTGTNFTFTANNDTKTFTTSNRWWPISPTFTPVAVTSHTVFMLYMQMSPTANPGSFYMAANITYQLIG